MTDSSRPYSPPILRERLLAASVRHDGQALTQQQFDLVGRLMAKACGNDRDQRTVTRWLFGAEWVGAMADSQVLAALDWLQLLELATAEARLVLSAAIAESEAKQLDPERT